jgi:flagellar basal body-associated protein FliL
MANPRIKPKPKQSDNFILYVVGGALMFVLIGFGIAWVYFQQNNPFGPPVAYATFGPIIVREPDFSIKATIVVQTSGDNASWLDNNKKQLDFALQNALSKADPLLVHKPDGLAYVQGMLRENTNGALKTQNVQEILLTDFIIQAN